MINDNTHLSIDNALALAHNACLGVGVSAAVARSLAQATVSAQACGSLGLGFRHLLDYLAGFTEGRIDGSAQPQISSPATALFRSNAKGGIAQLGFDLCFDELQQRAENFGIALFAQSHSYTTGELGYYVRRLVERGLVAFAATNGPALMTFPGGKQAVFCTNPLAFGAPAGEAGALLIDQASSATALVNLLQAAEGNGTIPKGWAVDANGQETTRATEALSGMLLAFGGARGANIALMVEVLAAGLTGANWSLDAPDFLAGDRSPGAGLLIIAIKPQLIDDDFCQRVGSQLQRLHELGLHIPGWRKRQSEQLALEQGLLLPTSLVRQVQSFWVK